MEITGGCYCGAVRYRIEGEVRASTLCHCQSCRRCVGAQSVAWITVARADFSWVGENPAQFVSSPPVIRTFCGKCGASLSYTHGQRPEEIDVTTGSLDDPEAFPPTEQVFSEFKLSWA